MAAAPTARRQALSGPGGSQQTFPPDRPWFFYFAFAYEGVEHPSEVYAELERAARDEILRSGGSLSHHHGVGKLRQPFLPRVFSPAALELRRALKRTVDPDNLLAGGNG